ncbi:hypothetical protein [Spiroplasma endosymbiont of Asaphidion curtum]|uniref:hypothetical protein n=1 Tax=Spiroplasma endosymbiont of Asaphidion curtum TaxID=3066281 RepID=UPI00313D735B
MYKKGDVVRVKCTAILPWGVFYVVENYVDSDDITSPQPKSEELVTGLCHISQFSDGFVKDINEFAEVDKIYFLQVLGYDADKRQLSLSHKAIVKEEENRGSVFIKESGAGFEDLSNNLSEWIVNSEQTGEKGK